jgi:hypothetical protein
MDGTPSFTPPSELMSALPPELADALRGLQLSRDEYEAFVANILQDMAATDGAAATDEFVRAAQLDKEGETGSRMQELMRCAPLDEEGSRRGTPADTIMADHSVSATRLRQEGMVRVDGVLTPEVAASLLASINDDLATSLASVEAGGESEEARLFNSQLLCYSNRFDLKLPLRPDVRAALRMVLRSLGPLLIARLKSDAELFELAALISDPGAQCQPVHPDTPWQGEDDGGILTVFVALQDVEAEMGPTVFLPGTHTQEAHRRFNESREQADLLSTTPRTIGLLRPGDCSLFDSRLLHSGGENSSSRRRVLFYFSFKAAATRSGDLDGCSLRATLHKKYRLEDLAPEPSVQRSQ